ncbi:MAG TPA: GPR1/FUN34/YaaH family transporter, partial [Balneolaceae bacterium]|nr:GPR1/FUN34/YaaH family transporter [Balneolaceae bacterium]
MDNQLADSKVLGYAAIFITGWIYSMFNAHWITSQMPEVDLVTGLILGGAVLSIVGILSYFRGETYEMTLFLGLGAFFLIVSLSNILSSSMGGSSLTMNMGWVEIVWAIFFFYLWLGVMRKG